MAEWQEAIRRITPAIVVVRTCHPVAFDGSSAGYSYATGFVVDVRGIILTNRHVVTSGPITADAVFHNKEEVPIKPIYRDPLHDFGFMRFDPLAVKHLKLVAIPLSPSEATVGTELRVIGNDAGERLSILAGTLARIDRSAPFYGGGSNYSDCNTFYYGAASSTSGGSSGSPVVNIHGRAIALNAGGKRKAASSYYLPLDRVVRALALLQAGIQVPRGGLLTVFRHKPFGELKRLALSDASEAQLREAFPTETGALVVDQVLEDSPAAPHLQAGDVLLKVNGKLVTRFIPLEEALDNTIAAHLACTNGDAEPGIAAHTPTATEADTTGDTSGGTAAGAGGSAGAGATAPEDVAAEVDAAEVSEAPTPPTLTPFLPGAATEADAVPATPDGGIVAARRRATVADLPFVAAKVDDLSVDPCDAVLQAFIASTSAAGAGGDGNDPWSKGPLVELTVERGGELLTRLIPVINLHGVVPSAYLTVSNFVVHPLSFCAGYMLAQDDLPAEAVILAVGTTRVSTLEQLEEVLAAVPDGTRIPFRYRMFGSRTEAVAVVDMDRHWFPAAVAVRDDAAGFFVRRPLPDAPPKASLEPSTASFPRCHNELAAKLCSCLVTVSFHLPVMVDGAHSWAFVGAGLVVDAAQGLVVVDRNTVSAAIGDARVNVAGSFDIPAKVLGLHPVHNYAVLQYDPALVGDTPIGSAKLSATPARSGDKVLFVGINDEDAAPVYQTCTITKREPLLLGRASAPRFRAVNEEVYHFADRVAACLGGVFARDDGEVFAIWASYSDTSSSGKAIEHFYGLPADMLLDLVEPLKAGEQPAVRHIDAELDTMRLSHARQGMGFPEEWIRQLEVNHPDKRQVLMVSHAHPFGSAATQLKDNDLIYSIDGTTVATFRDVELAALHKPEVSVQLVRDLKPITVTVATDSMLDSWEGTNRCLQWAGLLLQTVHRAPMERALPPVLNGEPFPDAPYISRWAYGSPAHKYGVRATWWILEVNGKACPTLDALVAIVRDTAHGDDVRLLAMDIHGKTRSYTLKVDYIEWPTMELRREAGTVDATAEAGAGAGSSGGDDGGDYVRRLGAREWCLRKLPCKRTEETEEANAGPTV